MEDSLSYEDAKPQEGSNHWSSTEYNRNNGRNVNFGSGNANNNNKYNGYVGRAVAVFGDYSVPLPFILSVWEAYVFRGDIVSFFMSIDKDLLWYLLERFMLRWRKRMVRLGDAPTIDGWYGISWSVLCRLGMDHVPNMYWAILMRTTKIIVMHHPEKNCVLNSPIEWWRSLDASKSLFTSPTGEPIGNLTTQQFANFLMSFFVAYVQYLYRRKNYGMAQFVDDFALTCDDLRYVVRTIPLLEIFLRDKLHLMMHKNKRYLQPVAHGVLFVGTFIKPGRLYLSNRTIARITEKCNGYAVMLADEEHLSVIDLEHIEQVLNSYLGFCRHRATYRFRQHFIAMIGNKFWKFYYVKGHYDSVKLKLKYTI